MRRPLYEGEHFSFAIAPQGLVYLRGADGGRAGGLLIGAVSSGQHGLVLNLGWSVATDPGPGNPRHLVDFMGDYGYSLAEDGFWSRWSIFGGYLVEKGSGQKTVLSLEQGLSVRVRPDFVLDVAVVENGLAAGDFGATLLFGFTYNFGRIRPR